MKGGYQIKPGMMRRIAVIIVCLLLSSYFIFSSKAYALNVNRNVFPNGLIVLHSENHSLPIVTVSVIIKAGQLDEPKEKAGLANIVAGLLTEGTKSRSAKDISEEADFIGASLNASAGGDYITVTLSVLKKDLNKGFELLSDILLNPVFPQEEIDRKRERVKGFLRQREEEPSFLADRAFRTEVFGEHPYGRLLEGSPETIDTIKRDDIIKFYSDYLLPNNAILSVSGDLTSEELNGLIKEYLDGWKRATPPLRTAASHYEMKVKKVIKIDKDLTQANILLGNLGISRDNPDYYAVSVLNYILGGGGFSSRLMQSVRDEMGLAYDVHTSSASYKEGGNFQIGLQTKNESANIAIDEILKQVERIRKDKVSDQELSDAKSYLTGSFPRRLDTNRKIADFLAAVEFYDLGLDFAAKYSGYINAVTKDDVLRVARKYLTAESYTLVIVADQRKAMLKY
jgi:zinc protease